MNDSGNGKTRILESLNKKSEEEIMEMARVQSDTDGAYQVRRWLEGQLDLKNEEIEKLLLELPLMF